MSSFIAPAFFVSFVSFVVPFRRRMTYEKPPPVLSVFGKIWLK